MSLSSFLRRVLIPVAVLGATAAVVSKVAHAQKKKLVSHFEGSSASEAHAKIVEKVQSKTDDEAKAQQVADYVVAKLVAHGVVFDDSEAPDADTFLPHSNSACPR